MREVFAVFVFIIVWCVFCAIADYGLELGANSWRMLFGYGAGLISWEVYQVISTSEE